MAPKINRQERMDDRSTERARVILRAIVEHGTMAGAASALGVSTHSVDAQLDLLRAQLGLRYLPQLVAWAASQGWLDGLPKRPNRAPMGTGGAEFAGNGGVVVGASR